MRPPSWSPRCGRRVAVDSDADGLGEPHPGHVGDLDRLALLGGVHDLIVADVYPDVADRLVEEHEVARLQFRPGDRGADPGHGPRHAGQSLSGVAERPFTSPEQSKALGPAAPHRYGAPSFESALNTAAL